jgi:hypothetical protein
MDLLSPLRLGVHVATGAVKLATAVPRLVKQQLRGDDDAQRWKPTGQRAGTPRPGGTPSATPAPSGPARGGTGRRAPSPRATPGRAAAPDGDVEIATGPPEPTSAAGASGAIAGTAAVPGDAAIAGAPDPTTATVPQGERRTNDVSAPPVTRARRRTEPKRSEVDRRRAEERQVVETSETTLAETEGAAAPGAALRVAEPWDGYAKMKATDIIARVQSSDDAAKAVVRLYEQTHKKRKSVIDATGS